MVSLVVFLSFRFVSWLVDILRSFVSITVFPRYITVHLSQSCCCTYFFSETLQALFLFSLFKHVFFVTEKKVFLEQKKFAKTSYIFNRDHLIILDLFLQNFESVESFTALQPLESYSDHFTCVSYF